MIKSKTAGFLSVVSRAHQRQGVVPGPVRYPGSGGDGLSCQPSLLSFLLSLSITPFSTSHLYLLPILSEQLRPAWHFNSVTGKAAANRASAWCVC